MSFMDNDVIAGIVCAAFGYIVFVLILGAIMYGFDRRNERRRFRPYDGGCIHDPHTCATCLTARWRHPSSQR